MALSNPSAADLSRYSVGEITQLVGPNIFYNAGASKWLRTGQFTASANLGTAAKNNLAAGSTSSDINISLLTAIEASITTAYPHMPVPAQRISSAGVTVIAGCSGTTTPIVTAVTSAGAQNISLPITSVSVSSATGSNICVASNNTTIFAYSVAPAGGTFVAASTTDGLNWSSITPTGLPSFINISGNKAYGSSNDADCQNSPIGKGTGGTARFAIFWCGARFILIAADVGASQYFTSTSTNGIAWSGDTTTAVLGKSGDATSSVISFYKNGNNCYLNLNDCQRYTTDGGITWASSTGSPFNQAGNQRQKVNATLPAKLFYHNKSTSATFSADNGATWTSRTLPANGGNGTASLAYRGSTVLLNTTGFLYRSVDDGATWVSAVLPAGTLNNAGVVFGDANRFYFCPQTSPQILTSTDGITWTIVSVPANYFYALSNVGGIISFDSNNVILMGYNSNNGYDICALTNDGGVTWKTTTINYNQLTAATTSAGDAFVSPDGLGGGTTAFGGTNGGGYYGGTTGNVISKQTAVAGGGFYRSGSTAVTPTNANATVYTRVE
jgi:hypothetical protein